MEKQLGTPVMTSERIGAKAVLVIWDDAVNQFGWLEGEEVAVQDGLVESVGWLMSNTRDYLLMAQSLTEGSHGQTLQIPIGMVKSIRTLG